MSSEPTNSEPEAGGAPPAPESEAPPETGPESGPETSPKTGPAASPAKSLETGVADPLDVESLLLPISEASPAGEDVRYAGPYDRIAEARRADDPSLPQGVWERGLKKADWDRVLSLARDTLIRQSKDAQIGVWFLEAALHRAGFAGVSAGLRLLVGLCRTFWDDLHPRADGDDLESRLAPFIWLNEKLALELKRIPITRPGSRSDAVPYDFADWEWAERLENLAERDRGQYERAMAEGRVTRAKFLGSVMFSPADFYQAQEAAIVAAQARLRELSDFLDERCGKDAPTFRQFGEVLSNILDLTRTFLNEKREKGEVEDDSQAPPPTPGTEEDGSPEARTGAIAIRSRADAYRVLSAAADYLLIHEPHSPTPYLVKRAVSWGHMTLTELLHELIQDEHDLNQIFKLLGLQSPPGGDNYDGY
ncbi:MAG: type VI secretion system protein TssA [Desulfococcaceae bacterium]